MNNYKVYLSLATSFVTGASTLIFELIAFRILAPYFGTSIYVSGIIINTVLFALALGYYLGGYYADKLNNFKIPFILILFTCIYLSGIYIYYQKLLVLVENMDVITGSAISILIMFFIPMIALAFIPTYLIKILAKTENIGKTAGKLYAISTFGSIFGGILTTFILIPYVGSSNSFVISILLLLIIAIVGLFTYSKSSVALSLLFPVLLIVKPSLKEDHSYYSKESAYNIIKITKNAEETFLHLNSYAVYHSKSLDKNHMSNSYYDYFLFGPVIKDVKNVLILGNCAGTTMSSLSHFFDLNITGVEIDPELTEIGKKFFNLELNDRKKVVHQDARVFLRKNNEKFDMIIIDLYNGNAHVPFHLATAEFFKTVYESLNSNGILLVNVPGYAMYTDLEKYYMSTIQNSFKNNFLLNHVLLSFKDNISKDEIINKLKAYNNENTLKEFISKSLPELEGYSRHSANPYFTDDFSQIEKLSFNNYKL